METDRHYSGIGRATGVACQNIHHFMSNSPWEAQAVCTQVLDELKATPELVKGGIALIDESAEEKSSDKSAGSAKQYNGRLGKVETSPVSVLLSYVNLTIPQGFWSWIGGKLFLPQVWFERSHQKLRKRLGIPSSQVFKTKVELAFELITEAIANGLPFEIVGFDSLYGRSGWLRTQIHELGQRYMAEIPSDTQVYLDPPVLGIPARQGQRGRKPSQVKVFSPQAVQVDALREQVNWRSIRLRTTERGELCERFAAIRVWTVHHEVATQQWLVMREESHDKYSYALCNACEQRSLKQLAWWKCQRYFIERSNQDSKSQLGFDELRAQKYRAFEHHLALTINASWFVAQTKFEWAKEYPRDPALLQQLETDTLPALSVANVRELLRAVMPLKQLTVQQATERVIEHFLNRARSQKSRLKKQRFAQNSGTASPDG